MTGKVKKKTRSEKFPGAARTQKQPPFQKGAKRCVSAPGIESFMDQPYKIAWKAGDCIVHASSEREAKEIAVEHIRALDIVSVTQHSPDYSDENPASFIR